MNAQVAAAWALLPDYLSQHVLLSAAALGLGLLISLPLAVPQAALQVGLQAIGHRGHDHALLRLALRLEAALG